VDIFFLNTAKPSDLQIAVLVLMLLLCLRNLCFNGSIILPRPSQQVHKYLYCAIYRFHAYAAEQSYWKTWLRAQRAQTSAKVSIILQLKVIRVSNSDFRINSDPDVCRIAPKMLWIRYLAWRSGRTSVFDRRTFAVLRSTYSWRVTTYVGKPSALGQPTRPTQPFILSGPIDE